MTEDGAKGSDGFEPPKYLASLIAAVNDGAKAAQAGALVFALVGVYLLATAFSANDEDLLRGRTVTISQIGATLPVSFSFAIAPFVFVFLHFYTLARYDMLAANVRQFLAELPRTVPVAIDRERCRQLLANVEFILAWVAQPGSRLYSRVWWCLVWVLIAVFPVIVLLLVQVNALRYQSELITRLQQFGVLLDLVALVWFFHRASLDRLVRRPRSRMTEVRRWAKLLWLPVIVMGLNFLYLNVVPAKADAQLVRYEGQAGEEHTQPLLKRMEQYLAAALVDDNPLDVVVCPSLQWGCRFLRVGHRTLVDHVWDEKAIVDLRRASTDLANALAAIEGLVLRDRSLRFAVLDESLLLSADLTGADLRNATLRSARLPGARLQQVQLRGADLTDAQLQGADLGGAQLQGANLSSAPLQGANLYSAQLQGADLVGAQLQGANLLGAQLQGASLGKAQLQGADLLGAQLQGASLNDAQLQFANLALARLQGAQLTNARLQSADLGGAQMQGTDLNAARLGGAIFGRGLVHPLPIPPSATNLELSDLRWADFTTLMTDDEMKGILATLGEIANSNQKAAATRQVALLFTAGRSKDRSVFTATAEQQVLVSDPKNPVFADIPTNWLITSPTPAYTTAFVTLLADQLAAGNSGVANGIGQRAIYGISKEETRSLYGPLACRLLANVGTRKVKLEQNTVDYLSNELLRQRIECAAKPAAAH